MQQPLLTTPKTPGSQVPPTPYGGAYQPTEPVKKIERTEMLSKGLSTPEPQQLPADQHQQQQLPPQQDRLPAGEKND
jgi:hypothetical protein